MRHRQRLQERRENGDSEQKHKSTEQQYQEGLSTSSVCVWPFFCERDSQVLQTAQSDYDEIYGFEYENNDGQEEEEGFALQLMDVNAMMNLGSTRRRHKRRSLWNINNRDEVDPDAECLLSFPSNSNGLQIGSCSSEEAWLWHVNRDGILVRGSTKAEKRKRKRRWRISPRRASAAAAAGSGGRLHSSHDAEFGCIHRANSSSAMLLPCGGGKMHTNKDSLVGFSLVRYPSTLSEGLPSRRPLDASDSDGPAKVWEPWTTLEGPTEPHGDIAQTPGIDSKGKEEDSHLPHSRTSSQSHASAGAKRNAELKSTASMLHTSLEQGGKAKKDAATSASHIRDSPTPIPINGLAFHNQLMNRADERSEQPTKGPSSTKLRLEKKSKDGRNARARGQTPIHEDSSEASRGSDAPDSNPHRPRKIPVHPYIQSSKDFVWVDPLTSLRYPTDLCNYLGHTKKEAGRHTLMGVGQYFRTAFKVKVYGAALYVAKRDVLADPKFAEYAVHSAEELRGRDDFYDHLMNMPSPGEDPANAVGGFFDRTLFIKINMQLSTDAMRKSLEADWSLLTEEMKSLIIGSSFKERMADERMQQKIQNKENSSNCSCGQLASPELGADPSCCARGTELVFTWRKNGDFEIRLDGRLMDIFPRPDIARGIFSEYMNNNPISLDAKAHFTDGFPFLLAPLAQVKGMSSAVPNQTHEPAKTKKSPSGHGGPMHRLMGAANSMGTVGMGTMKWMQESAAGMSSNALGSAMGVARGLSEELDKQRMDLFDNAVALQKEGMEMLSSLIKQSAEEDGFALTIVDEGAAPTLSPSFFNGFGAENAGLKMASPEIIPDEIGIKIDPAMNFTHQLFFTAVHVYLLLMFIVSIPGSYTNRVVRRRILETKRFVEERGAFAGCNLS